MSRTTLHDGRAGGIARIPVVARCKRLGVPVAAGGPHPSIAPESLPDVDHLFIVEAEGAIAAFAEDLEHGRARPVYRADGFPELDTSPVPRFDLLDLEAYASMAVQHSRGCPFSCEFCDIWKLYGRRHRVKSPQRLAADLDALRAAGWRGSVFFVEDNFIGNRRLAKRSLEALESWQREHGFPSQFFTEASVNLGDDDELMRRAEADLIEYYAEVERQDGVKIAWRQTARTETVRFAETVMDRVVAAARARGLATERIVSGAGHDAQELARVTRAGMVFVPLAEALKA